MTGGWRGGGSTYQCLRFLDVLLAKEELAVQVAQVDCVKVDNVDFAETGEQEVLEKLAADPSGTHQQDAGLKKRRSISTSSCRSRVLPEAAIEDLEAAYLTNALGQGAQGALQIGISRRHDRARIEQTTLWTRWNRMSRRHRDDGGKESGRLDCRTENERGGEKTSKPDWDRCRVAAEGW